MKKCIIRFGLFLVSCVLLSCSSVPAGEAVSEKGSVPVRLADGVCEEMLSASYWISRSKNPYRIQMSRREIGEWNRRMMNKSYGNGMNLHYFIKDLRTADSYISAREIRDCLSRFSPRAEWYEMRGSEAVMLQEEDWLRFYKSMNYASLGSVDYFLNHEKAADEHSPDADYPVRKGICVCRSDLRLVPDATFYCDDAEIWYDDMAQNSGIQINEPVLIVWESADKNWLFVHTSYCTGWIRREHVAFCSDAEFARYFDYERKNPSDFVTVTDERVTLPEEYFVKDSDSSAAREFFMGNYLFCADWNDERFSDEYLPRIPYASYIVEIPYRTKEGNLGITYASFPAGSCTRGLLDYTKANVLTLAFKSLGIRYGWGGMARVRDCSEYLKDIFHCFGFNFPRNSSAQMQIPGKTVELSGKSVSARRAALKESAAGAVTGFPGHVMLYLGSESSKQYVISALGSYYPAQFDENDEESEKSIITACSVNVNTLDVYRRNRKTWLENLTSVKSLVLDGNKTLIDFEREISLDENWAFAEGSVINEGKAILYKARTNRKNRTVAVNAGHGCAGGAKKKVWSHPDHSPKLTTGTDVAGVTESTAVSDGMVFVDGKTEAEVNLRQAHMLKKLLLEEGYDVLMIRDGSDVQLDNVARTVISNNCADIHIAIHYDNDGLSYDKGSFYCSIPEGLKKLKNVKKHADESERLGQCLVAAIREHELPVYKDGTFEMDLVQISYSTIPTVDIELGNRQSVTSSKMLEVRAQALADGVKAFFAGK